MSAAALFAILALVQYVVCQSTTANGNVNNGGTSDFQIDALTTGILALFCIFTFLFLVLTIWCFVALVLARGHRSPYAFLFPALIFSVLSNADNIALEVFLNMPSWYVLPTQLQPALEAIGIIFTNLAILLLFLSIVAVLWNRENAIHAAAEGKAGQRNHAFTAIFALLAVIIFALGIAAPAVYVDALRKYLMAMNEINLDFDVDPTLEEEELDIWFDQQRKVWSALSYSFSSFVVFSGFVVIVATILLWRKSRAVGIRDKITNTMLYVIVPLYAAYNLFTFIFTIVFSDHGLPYDSSLTKVESATLANNILLLLSYFAVALALLVLSINRVSWNIGGTAQPINIPAQQYWSQPAQPYYGSQQHMQPYNPQPITQPMYYYNGPQPYVPAPQIYETPAHSPQTQQASLEYPSKPTTPG